MINFYTLVQKQAASNYILKDANKDDYLIVFSPELSVPANVRLQIIHNSELSSQIQTTCVTKDIQEKRFLFYACPQSAVEQICTEGFKNISKEGE